MLNILVAYPYLKPDIIAMLAEHQGRIRFLLDSGAFTAWKAGKPVDLDDYCRFLESLPLTPWRYFSLDVIGDPHRSMVNYELMLKRGFKPIPVFTRGEDVSMVDELYKTAEVIGVGGLVGTKGNRGFVKGIMAKIGKRPCHWLGFTNKTFVKVFKPYSCDSSSVVAANKFGAFELFDYRTGLWGKHVKAEFAKKPTDEVCDLIRSYGVDPRQLAKVDNWAGGNSLSSYISFRSHIRAQRFYEKKLGTYYFIAPVALVGLPYLRKSIEIYDQEANLWGST